MSDSQRSDNDPPACEGGVRWTRLSEQEALRILMQPSPPDRFSILNRRGRRLSDTQIVQILQEPSDQPASGSADSPPPLPIARPAQLPAVPLNYRNRVRDARRRPEVPLTALPLGYRILRVAVWAVVAAVMLLVMIHSL